MKIQVIVHPNAKKSRIEQDMLDTIHVYVNQPPLEGKANKAVIDSLAEYFNVKKNCIRIVSGEKSKYKLIEVMK